VPEKRPKYNWSAKSIRALRSHLDMTQQEMSDELGVRQQTVSDWELGHHQPRGGMARLLSIVAERADFEYNVQEPPPALDGAANSESDDAPNGA
jgi:DNA-binding XRE family transcriptional regulator